MVVGSIVIQVKGFMSVLGFIIVFVMNMVMSIVGVDVVVVFNLEFKILNLLLLLMLDGVIIVILIVVQDLNVEGEEVDVLVYVCFVDGYCLMLIFVMGFKFSLVNEVVLIM